MQGDGSPCSPFGPHSNGVPTGKSSQYRLELSAMHVTWTTISLYLTLPMYAIYICILLGLYVFHCNFILPSAALHCPQHLSTGLALHYMGRGSRRKTHLFKAEKFQIKMPRLVDTFWSFWADFGVINSVMWEPPGISHTPLLGWVRSQAEPPCFRPQAVEGNMKKGREIDFIALSFRALMKINGHFIHNFFALLVGES